jgi:hypothetical protein
MKRVLVATILGIAAAASTYGQGKINFDTYAANNYGADGPGAVVVTQTPGGALVVGTGWNVQMAYILGSASDAAGTGDLVGPWLLNAAVIAPSFNANGQIQAGIYTLPNYSAGSITMEMLVFNGSSYAASTFRGHSAAFTMASIATGPTPPGTPDGLASFVVLVPEPSTFALAGLGAAALLIFRRRN